MKIAVLDLGTNTFHLLIAEVRKDKVFKKIFKSKVVVKLGEGAIHKKLIADVPFARGINALHHYADVIKQFQPEKIFAFATSAIRSAANGKKFVAAAKKETGIDIRVIRGEKEAELIYYGVRQCVDMSDEKQLIMDIGGGSTEFIIANRSKIFWKRSFNLGASRLLELFQPADPIRAGEVRELEKYFKNQLTSLDRAIKKYPVRSLIGSSGSFDTLAEMIGWRFYGKDILKGHTALWYDLNKYKVLHKILLQSTNAQRMKMKGLVKMRVDIIVLASICTNYILTRYGLQEMILSKYALKEGAMWKAVQQLQMHDE